MEKKLKTDIKFMFEPIEEVPVFMLKTDFNKKNSLAKKIEIINIKKTSKMKQDVSTRLF